MALSEPARQKRPPPSDIARPTGNSVRKSKGKVEQSSRHISIDSEEYDDDSRVGKVAPRAEHTQRASGSRSRERGEGFDGETEKEAAARALTKLDSEVS